MGGGAGGGRGVGGRFFFGGAALPAGGRAVTGKENKSPKLAENPRKKSAQVMQGGPRRRFFTKNRWKRVVEASVSMGGGLFFAVGSLDFGWAGAVSLRSRGERKIFPDGFRAGLGRGRRYRVAVVWRGRYFGARFSLVRSALARRQLFWPAAASFRFCMLGRKRRSVHRKHHVITGAGWPASQRDHDDRLSKRRQAKVTGFTCHREIAIHTRRMVTEHSHPVKFHVYSQII